MKKSRLLMFLFLFLWSIGMMAADGDVFTVKVDEYDMTFRVLSEVDKTVQTGAVLEKPGEGKFDYKAARCIDEGVSGTLTIPAVVSHDGADYHVVRIGVASFYALKALEKVVIPEGVESIGVDAFSNYEFEALSLSQVILPSTLRIIENSAFSQIDGAVGEGNFKSIVIPEGVERIEAAAFVNNSMLESVQLPSTLKFLGDNAFGVSALTSITVPASTIEIEGQPFAFTRTLTSLIVEAENPFYDSRDNCNAIIETATNTLQEGTVATVIPSSIRIIGKSAFSGLGNLGKFNIPEGVECIEESAFYDCLYESLSLPHTLRIIGDYAFSHWGDLGLSTIVIPEGVETIGEYAFSGQNEMLKRVELPSTLKSLGSYIFNSCPNLEDVYCTATVPCKITGSGILMPPFGDNSGMVSATLHVPVGSKGFYESAFGFDHFSRFVEIGKEDLPTFSAMVDGYEMFFRVLDEDAKTVQIGLGEKEQNCIKADSNDERWGTILNIQIPTSVTDPSTGKTYSVTAIGEYAFSYIMPQQDLVIPEGITSIYSNAFLTNQYQVNLQSVKLPESLNEISSHAFEGHMKLTDINMPKNLKIIGNSAFYGIGIKELTLPEGITYIGNDVFGCCTSLTNVKLPSDMKVLPEGMFRDSPFVVLSIELPEGLEEIGTKALMSTKIEHLKLPSTLKKIGTYGVQVISYYLKDVTALSATPPVLEDGSFTYWENNECDVITLYVPIGSKSAYEKAPGWSEFKNIVEIDETEDTTEEDIGEDAIKITSAGQTTWCSAYDLDFTDVEGLKAYTATGYHRTRGTIWLTRVKEVPAGEGILLIGDEGEYKVPHKSTTAYYANLMVGTVEAKTINETDGEYTNYYLSNGDSGVGFYKVNGSVDLKANRAYLPLLKSTTSGSRGFIGLDFDDGEEGTTGISEAQQRLGEQDVYYNLQGQRVNNPGKGVYIMNGKKVIVK